MASNEQRVPAYKVGLVYGYVLPPFGANPGKHFYVSPSGTNGSRGGPDTPFQTLTYAVSQATDNVPCVIHAYPGEYAEVVSVNRRKVSIVGEIGPRNPGIVSIVGTAGQTSATITVPTGFLNGFHLANVRVSVGGAYSTTSIPAATTWPCISLTTNDVGADRYANAPDYWSSIENVECDSNGDAVPSAGLWLRGVQSLIARHVVIGGCTLGVALSGSEGNAPRGIRLEDFEFIGNVTADVATTAATTGSGILPINGDVGTLSSVYFKRPHFLSRGTGAVTNYINLTSTVTCTNVSFSDAVFARDVLNGTLIATLPTNVVVMGESPAGHEAIVG